VDIDAEQLEFLMSQAIDGQLSAEESERLKRDLADDADARAEFERMKRLNDLIGQWGGRPAPVADDHAAHVLGQRVRQDAEFAISRVLDGEEQAEGDWAAHAQRDPHLGLLAHQYRRLERVVRAWGSIEPPIDHERLYERLCETIHAEAAGRVSQWPRRIIRLYTPLAAAASLAIVAGLWWSMRSGPPTMVPGPARVEFALVGPPAAAPQAKPVVEFSFDLAPDAPIQSVARAGEGSGVVISVGGFMGPRERPSDGVDEAVF